MTDLPANVRPTVKYDMCLYKYTGNSKNPPKHSLPARKEGIGSKRNSVCRESRKSRPVDPVFLFAGFSPQTHSLKDVIIVGENCVVPFIHNLNRI